ncbi:MAG: hypothetical protein A2029_17215 [Chloroflexi bacterium RBG_19FT_COMBO_47_9]|nr:MAG: hypothetical protein A2029_17215 [Chloroflexi bacterium RBG_19FT_COMBO_47_9]
MKAVEIADKPYILTSIGHFTVELCSNFLPVLYPIYIATAGITYSQVGILAFLYVFFASATQPIFGFITDRWYPGRLAIIGVFWVGSLMGLIGFLNNFVALAFLISLSALGSSIYHPSAASITSGPDPKIEGRAMAYFSISGNLGAALSPLFIGILLRWFSLRSTIVLIPISLLVGFSLLRFSLQNARVYARVNDSPDITKPYNKKMLIVLGLILIGVMFRSWFYYSVQTYLPFWVNQLNNVNLSGENALFIIMFTVGLGSLIGGWLSDRIGPGMVMALGLGLLSPFYWLFLSPDIYSLYFSLIGMGVLVGFTFPTSIVLAQSAWPRSVGLVSALVIGLAWVPGGIGASVTGMIADKFSLEFSFNLLLIPPILGAISIISAQILRSRFINRISIT